MIRFRSVTKPAPARDDVGVLEKIPVVPASQPAPVPVYLERSGRWTTLVLCLALASVALGLNFYRIGLPSIWFDEALSVTRAQQTLPVLYKIVSVTQPNMALYYFLLHFWLNFLHLWGMGATEAAVRCPSALCAAIDTLVLYFLARRFFSQILAVLVSLCYTLNTLQLTYAQETRAYTLQLLLVLLSWYALLALSSGDLSAKAARGWWICFVLSSALAVYAQLFSALVLTAQALAVLLLLVIPNAWRGRVRRRLRGLVGGWASVGVLIAPLLYASRVGAKTGWLPVPGPRDVYHLFLTISAQSKILSIFWGLLILAGLLAVLPWRSASVQQLSQGFRNTTEALFWSKRSAQFFPLAICLLCWLLCPVIISYLVSQTTTRLFSARYLVVIVPALLLLVALGLAVPRRRLTQLVLGLGLVLLCLSYVPGYYQSAQVEDWRTGTRWLQNTYLPGDGLICYDNLNGCAVDIQYYLQTYPHGDARVDADAPGYFPWVNYDTTNHPGNSEQALDIDAIQRYAAEHSRFFFALGRANESNPRLQAAMQWLATHYRLLAREKTSTLTIFLYETTSEPLRFAK